ncbi:MAG: glycine cleavage system aminomethyltransferase T [Candidatus Poriferisodalaceae bacterium]|jgi:glycine cleavage system aminomethyltransferase T
MLCAEDDVDLDPETFRYMQVREGTVAGVENCVMWRIGFTGELSYELHVPAGHGLFGNRGQGWMRPRSASFLARAENSVLASTFHG